MHAVKLNTELNVSNRIRANELFRSLGMDPDFLTRGGLEVTTPIDGSVIAHVPTDDAARVSGKIGKAATAFPAWRATPAGRNHSYTAATATIAASVSGIAQRAHAGFE